MSLAAIPEQVPLPGEDADAFDPAQAPTASSVGAAGVVPRHVARNLVTGTSAMGAGAIIERGLGFAANILAARFGGASTFGAYSLGITTAANISTYAAGGIGSTAARFSGKYPHGTAGYGSLARALAIVSVTSAVVAAAALWFGATPLAHILAKPSLAPLLRWAAFSAAGMILLECARGFFIGQRRLAALLLLSLLVGVGLLVLIPVAGSHHRPEHMIVSQAVVTVGAVLVCLALARPLGLFAPRSKAEAPDSSLPSVAPVQSVLGEVWSFGMVQLAGLVGMNLAGWWLTTLVARADTTLVQMSFFAIANQMRNIVGLAPSLLTESSYAIMAASHRAEPASKTPGQASDQKPKPTPNQTSSQAPDQTPDQVMALCTWFATASSLVLSALGIVVVPWALTMVYGHGYRAGALTTAVALAIAIVHMGNSPAAARLTIVSIRTSGMINTAWAVVVAGAGTLVLLRGGSAWQAMAVYLGAHLLSSALVMAALVRHRSVVPGVLTVVALGAATAVALAVLAWVREAQPWLALAATAAMLGTIVAAFWALAALGRRHRWMPTRAALGQFFTATAGRLVPARRAHGL